MTVRETPDDAYRFGHGIAVFAREREARLRASYADPVDLAAEISRQVDTPATRAIAAKLTALKLDGMTVRAAEKWGEAAVRGFRDGMVEGERVH